MCEDDKPNSVQQNTDSISELKRIRRSVETGFHYSRLNELLVGCKRATNLLVSVQVAFWLLLLKPPATDITLLNHTFSRYEAVSILWLLTLISWASQTHMMTSMKRVFRAMDREYFSGAIELIRLHNWAINPFSYSHISHGFFYMLMGSSISTSLYFMLESFEPDNIILNLLIFSLLVFFMCLFTLYTMGYLQLHQGVVITDSNVSVNTGEIDFSVLRKIQSIHKLHLLSFFLPVVFVSILFFRNQG